MTADQDSVSPPPVKAGDSKSLLWGGPSAQKRRSRQPDREQEHIPVEKPRPRAAFNRRSKNLFGEGSSKAINPTDGPRIAGRVPRCTLQSGYDKVSQDYE